ncbi:hypothetical protein GGI35DRAFT_117816 [Trichoderma velutinum]
MYPVRSAQYRSARTLTRSSRCAVLCLYGDSLAFALQIGPVQLKLPLLQSSLFSSSSSYLLSHLSSSPLSLPYPLIPSSIPPLPLPTLRVGRNRSFGLGLRRIESPDRLPLEDELPLLLRPSYKATKEKLRDGRERQRNKSESRTGIFGFIHWYSSILSCSSLFLVPAFFRLALLLPKFLTFSDKEFPLLLARQPFFFSRPFVLRPLTRRYREGSKEEESDFSETAS